MLNIVILEQCMESHLMFKFSCETPVIKVTEYVGFMRRISLEYAKSLGNILEHLEKVERTRKSTIVCSTVDNFMVVDDIINVNTHVSFRRRNPKSSQEPIFMQRMPCYVKYSTPTIQVFASSLNVLRGYSTNNYVSKYLN